MVDDGRVNTAFDHEDVGWTLSNRCTSCESSPGHAAARRSVEDLNAESRRSQALRENERVEPSLSPYIYIYIYIHTSIYLSISIIIYIYICMYMYIYIYIDIYIYIYISI